MNPLLLSGFGISIEVNKAHLIIKQKDFIKDLEPHRIPYDSIIIDGHYGSISFEAMRWLSKHDVSIALLNWNGNLLSVTQPQETLNADLKMKQYEKYHDPESRLYIASQIVKQKVKSSLGLIKALSKFYDIDLTAINREIQRVDYDNINGLMMYEGRIASAYWTELSKIFNSLAKDFNFQSRKNLSYSWNMNASDPVNALLNYGYAILESMVRKDINTIGLDVSIGYLHEIAPSKHPLVYDLQELFRYVVDYSVIELLETKLKRSDFITTENYHIRLKPNTAKRLIEKIKDNFNKRYEFRNKQHTLDNIMFENVRELSRYVSGKIKTLDFRIPDIEISRNDTIDMQDKIMSIDPEKRKALKINKSTLWYQQRKIKEGKTIKLYNKTKVKIE
ncbi:CRISPR-associated protein Cas1 [Thermogymnomonas acidicola]|uniref:CRISPR-associated endonuclease Cas1 n=1 Tax=Thermogymnomonas acidicola TaxID=399579 RepID=A0AA37BSF5_9ARCH|nr:CRISPR-associated endonuclease Cas1 [Thermogymnomonas acidicola]GGM77181.1 CRISPR-associated protein Cas1 [Thermogymnomonas acidicola]